MPKFIVDPRIAFMVNDILKEAAMRGTGRKIQQLGRSGAVLSHYKFDFEVSVIPFPFKITKKKRGKSRVKY